MFEFEPVTIKRSTRESSITTTIAGGPMDPNLKGNLNTSIHFLNHMIEQWAWRSCLNLSVEVEMREFVLQHVIAEDAGQCFGQALLGVADQLIKKDGINASGFAEGFIDEALAKARLSFEYRSGFYFDKGDVHLHERVEDMIAMDLWNFLGGVAQGARATIQIDLLKGDDPHHVWESVFRGFGEATRMALSPCAWRKGHTVGVAGFIEIEES